MADWTTYLLLAGFGVIIIYFLIYIPLTRKVAWKTIQIPGKTLKAMRSKRIANREVAYVFDFDHSKSPFPERVRLRTGGRDYVMPRANWDDEIIFHTHQQVKDPIENILRERPSATDLVQLMKSPRQVDGVITPTGRAILYEKTTESDIRAIQKLDDKEYKLQKKHFKKKGFTKSAAREVNRDFIRSAKKAGIIIKEVPRGQALRMRTEVRE